MRSIEVPRNSKVPHWFERRQLRDSIEVVIANHTGDCAANVVLFRPYGALGSASPDSVRPRQEGGVCVATAWWRLGEGVGRQHLRAAFADEPSRGTNITAIARALPRVGAGVVATWDTWNHRVVKTDTQVVRVTRRVVFGTSGDSTVAFDSLVLTNSLDTLDNEWTTEPALIVDFPLMPSARWLRGALGVSLENPDRDWYVGMSVLQPMFGVTRESVGVDLQFVLHAGRREVLRNPECDDDGNLDDCKTRDRFRFPMGFGLMGFVDGTGLISAAAGLVRR